MYSAYIVKTETFMIDICARTVSCVDLFVRIIKSVLTYTEYFAEEMAKSTKCTVSSIEKRREHLLREDDD